MIVGVDFDNTIVCYDRVFYRLARAKELIPQTVLPIKNEIRDFMRKAGREKEWTELQGLVYGVCMHEAEPFPGVDVFFKKCAELGIPVCIISHKTRYPYEGARYDLHKSAMDWINSQNFFSPKKTCLNDTVFLELTKEEKIQRIKKQNCTHFIDDLPEFLSEKAFPHQVHRILFDPHHLHEEASFTTRVSSWDEITRWITTRQNDIPS